MQKNLLREISPTIADFVSQHGMRVIVERCDQATFGNAVVETVCPEFDLRVVRDRGQIVLDVSPTGQNE